jgi:hypothetical protein
MDFSSLHFLNSVVQWIIAPVAAFVWVLYRVQNTHETKIAVLNANIQSLQKTHEREITEIRETSRAIMAKLSSIEEALRK